MSVTLSMSPASRHAKPWWRHRWPWLLMMGPFIVAVAGSYTGWLAYSQQDALVVGDYYKKGKAINQDLRRDRAASQLGVSAKLHFDAAQGTLAGNVQRTARSEQVEQEPITVHLAHATRPGKDIVLRLQPAPDGSFSVALPMLERSRWQVLVEGEHRGWRLEGSWSWPQQREVSLQADPALL